VLAVKLLVAYAIPDIPHKVAEEKARLEFLRREALKVVIFFESLYSSSSASSTCVAFNVIFYFAVVSIY